MITTPIWVSLVVGLLGGLGSAMFTQFLASRREAAARSYEHRRGAYVDFIKEFRAHLSYLRRDVPPAEEDGPDPPDDFLESLYDPLFQVQLFGTKKAARLAEKALRNLWDWVLNHSGKTPSPDEELASFLRQVRRDLSIPGGPWEIRSEWKNVTTPLENTF